MNNPGDFDTPCQFWEYVMEHNDYGEPIYNWQQATGAPKWCRVEPLKGMEQVEAHKAYSETQCKVSCRRWADIHPTNEIEFRGERWNIIAIQDYGRSGTMTLWTKRKE